MKFLALQRVCGDKTRGLAARIAITLKDCLTRAVAMEIKMCKLTHDLVDRKKFGTTLFP